MKAIILAAGRSPRMLPLTSDTPKCMLKIGDKTILEMQVDSLRAAGVEEIIVVTGFCSEKIEKLCNTLNVKTLFNPFYQVSGMALTLWLAKEEMKNEFLLLYSDVLFDCEIIKRVLERNEDICLNITKNEMRYEAEKVVEDSGKISGLSKLEGNGEFIGIAKFSSVGAEKLIDVLNSIARTSLSTSLIEVFNYLIEKGETIAACDISGLRFVDIDFPEDLETARILFKLEV